MKSIIEKGLKTIGLVLMLLHITADVNGQANYDFLNETCYVVGIDGDTINTGNLLMEDLLTNDQLDIFTFRYDSDTVITNRTECSRITIV